MLPIFVINLDRDKERLAAFSKQMKMIKRSFTRWCATAGDELDSRKFGIEPICEGVFITGFREWSKNEAACGVSHIKLLLKIVHENIPWTVILEDDALMLNRIPMNILEFNVPSDADIVLLNERAEVGTTIRSGKFAYGEVTGGAGTEGYMISLVGAQKMLKILYPLRDPLDFQMFSHFYYIQTNDISPFYWRLPQNPFAYDTMLKAYRVVPALVGHADSSSSIGGQRHPRARYYCKVLLGLDLPDLDKYTSISLPVNNIQPERQSRPKPFEYRAVDVSHLDESLSFFPAKNTKPLSPLKILKNNGINCVRISLWVDSTSVMNLDRALYLARKAKSARLCIYLVLHYSDSWADPTHQAKPLSWADMPFDLLCKTVYEYTRSVLKAMAAQRTEPVVVQIGNEISNGFLWAIKGQPTNYGGQIFFDEYDVARNQIDHYNKQWSIFAKLIGHAIAAVRETLPTDNSPKVMLQIDKGAFPEAAAWWFDKARAHGIDFDIIGLSYYFLWHHATVDELSRLSCLSSSFPDKDIMLAETSYPYREAEGITMVPPENNPPFTKQGQADYVRELLAAMRKLPNSCGICWWGAFFLNNKFDKCEDLFCAQALFDENGIALDALSAFCTNNDCL